MKKVILILVMAVTIVLSANAQKMNAKDVPTAVTTSFAKNFPTVKDPKWVKEDGNYEANFDFNKAETSAEFDASGTLLETETEISVSALPQPALDYAKKTYPDNKIKEASRIKDAKGIISYEAEMKGMDLVFDEKGKMLKEIKHEVKEKKD
ncbi:MAG: PepSY-like domain-containing protein [Bacteroidota bacterium]